MEEENKPWSVMTHGSLREGTEALGTSYGRLSHHWNAAIAMFLLAEPAERERWVQFIERARRLEDGRTILDRVRAMAKEAPPQHPWPPNNPPKIDPPPKRK